MSTEEWLRGIAMAASLIAITLSLVTIRRARRQAKSDWAKRSAPQWAEDGYRAGIMREPTILNAGVDISCTITADDVTRWKVGDELVSIPVQGGFIYISKAYADRMGIEGKAVKVVKG